MEDAWGITQDGCVKLVSVFKRNEKQGKLLNGAERHWRGLISHFMKLHKKWHMEWQEMARDGIGESQWSGRGVS